MSSEGAPRRSASSRPHRSAAHSINGFERHPIGNIDAPRLPSFSRVESRTVPEAPVNFPSPHHTRPNFPSHTYDFDREPGRHGEQFPATIGVSPSIPDPVWNFARPHHSRPSSPSRTYDFNREPGGHGEQFPATIGVSSSILDPVWNFSRPDRAREDVPPLLRELPADRERFHEHFVDNMANRYADHHQYDRHDHVVERHVNHLQEYTHAITIFVPVVVLRVYQQTLFGLPTVYSNRLLDVFQQTQIQTPLPPEFVQPSAPVGLEVVPLNPASVEDMIKLGKKWQDFIDMLQREWNTCNIISALLLSAVLTLFQISPVSDIAVTRGCSLVSLICSLMSLLYGGLYIVWFPSMKRVSDALKIDKIVRSSSASTWWSFGVLLAMPTVWLLWSLITFLICIMAFVWTSGTLNQAQGIAISLATAFAIRGVVTLFLVIGLAYLCLVVRMMLKLGFLEQRDIRRWRDLTPPPSAAEVVPFIPGQLAEDVPHRPRPTVESHRKNTLARGNLLAPRRGLSRSGEKDQNPKDSSIAINIHPPSLGHSRREAMTSSSTREGLPNPRIIRRSSFDYVYSYSLK